MSKLVACTACAHPVAYDAALCPRCGRETPAPLLWQLAATAKNLVLTLAGFAVIVGGIAVLGALFGR